ncbi:hypothetical protein LEP1GSC050_1721 [Leptospira broomii serovar Hurstbridge str. 5399]|uniref:Uncharacterized protein n=1 Tax=Leptospira broomii serovar Hurstbridge str. 5399 TaxID=1049789 RepID=T0GA13_9LEPT|nr:hypothetical protein [Leptospira broomii]EQA43634.1 hypothetical protein LEP1GSC050_1721 [Leptospira broomii serovar Hurstbridge str. 5399]
MIIDRSYMFLLSQESGSPILIWPEFSWTPVVNGLIFLALLVTTIYFVQKSINRRNQQEKSFQQRILAKLHLHEFNNKEVNLFHEFLDRIPYAELKRLTVDPAWYQKYFLPEFLPFLANHSNLPAWKDVLLVQSLDHLIQTSNPLPKNNLQALLASDSEESFPTILEVHEIDENLIGKQIKAKVYTKRGTHPFALTRYEKVQIYFRNTDKKWFKLNAVLISQQDSNLVLQIKSLPELDEKKTKEWVEAPRGDSLNPRSPDGFSEEYRDSLSQILSYSGLPSNVCEQIKNLVKGYKDHPGYVRRQHNPEDYKVLIRLYKTCFLKFRSDSSDIPKPVLLFIHFFFLEETILSGKRIQDLEASIREFNSSVKDPAGSEIKLSLHLLPDWLNLVLAGKKNPSRNQMGQSYEQVQKSSLLWNREPEVKNLHDKEYLLHLLDWELENTLHMGLLGISLNPSQAYPILSEDQFYGDTNSNLLLPKKLLFNADLVLKVDPGLFYREARSGYVGSSNQQDLIRKEFFADCILLPFSGNRGVFWQAGSNGNLTNSRLFFPTILNENVTLAVTKTMGEFRWETERSFRGRRWKDPMPPTLISEYYNYLENFQKNQNLTVEAKKRVDQQWIKVRHNIKDMFSIDYAYWILFEGSGKPRLNRTAREILARFIPISVTR